MALSVGRMRCGGVRKREKGQEKIAAWDGAGVRMQKKEKERHWIPDQVGNDSILAPEYAPVNGAWKAEGAGRKDACGVQSSCGLLSPPRSRPRIEAAPRASGSPFCFIPDIFNRGGPARMKGQKGPTARKEGVLMIGFCFGKRTQNHGARRGPSGAFAPVPKVRAAELASLRQSSPPY